jgi:hypothetical protein
MICETEKLRRAREDLKAAARALRDAPDENAKAVAEGLICNAITRHDDASEAIMAEIQVARA